MSEQISALVIARHAFEISHELPRGASQGLGGSLDYIRRRQHALDRVPGLMEEAESVFATDILRNLGSITLSHLNGERVSAHFYDNDLFKKTEARLDTMISPDVRFGEDAKYFAGDRFGKTGEIDHRFIEPFNQMELINHMNQYWIFSRSALARHRRHTVDGIDAQTGAVQELNYYATFSTTNAKDMLETALDDLTLTSNQNPLS